MHLDGKTLTPIILVQKLFVDFLKIDIQLKRISNRCFVIDRTASRSAKGSLADKAVALGFTGSLDLYLQCSFWSPNLVWTASLRSLRRTAMPYKEASDAVADEDQFRRMSTEHNFRTWEHHLASRAAEGHSFCLLKEEAKRKPYKDRHKLKSSRRKRQMCMAWPRSLSTCRPFTTGRWDSHSKAFRIRSQSLWNGKDDTSFTIN